MDERWIKITVEDNTGDKATYITSYDDHKPKWYTMRIDNGHPKHSYPANPINNQALEQQAADILKIISTWG